MNNPVTNYLAIMVSQRESAFDALQGLTNSQVWQRPVLKEWSIGEILDHSVHLYNTFYPLVTWMWKWFHWYGEKKRARTYSVEIADIYRSPGFPHWVGFLWSPKHTPSRPVSLSVIKIETEDMHTRIHAFYADKDPDLLGNLYLYDPIFGWCNLIVTLRIGIYHDQLHYEDAIKQAHGLK